MIPLNNGRSCAKNFGTFTSIKPRSSKISSSSSGKSRFKLPAAVMTDFTARMP